MISINAECVDKFMIWCIIIFTVTVFSIKFLAFFIFLLLESIEMEISFIN